MSLLIQVRRAKRKLHFTRAVYANYIRPPGNFDPNTCRLGLCNTLNFVQGVSKSPSKICLQYYNIIIYAMCNIGYLAI